MPFWSTILNRVIETFPETGPVNGDCVAGAVWQNDPAQEVAAINPASNAERTKVHSECRLSSYMFEVLPIEYLTSAPSAAAETAPTFVAASTSADWLVRLVPVMVVVRFVSVIPIVICVRFVVIPIIVGAVNTTIGAVGMVPFVAMVPITLLLPLIDDRLGVRVVYIGFVAVVHVIATVIITVHRSSIGHSIIMIAVDCAADHTAEHCAASCSYSGSQHAHPG